MKNSRNYFMSGFSFLIILSISLTVVITSCESDPLPDPDPVELAYVGSESCKACHENKYEAWYASGHPFKFSVVENGEAPVYPAKAVNFQDTWMSELGDGSHDWSDIAGVVGGFGWKARFVGTDGHIVGSGGSAFSTGHGHNQINFFGGENHGWVDYEVDKMEKTYNYSCFKCHTTGGVQEGTWLDGVDGLGNFAEQGIGCESCHGPGSIHADDPTSDNIDRVYEFAHIDNSFGGLEIYGNIQTPNPDGDDVNFLCGTCHNRGYSNSIDAKGGFIKHHEQWDELMSTPHGDAGLDCITCHSPHKGVHWNGDGIVKTCESCHDGTSHTNHNAGASCIDCHMPYAAKSGTKIGESGYRGDVRSHLLTIMVDSESMFNGDGSAVLDDETRSASLSPAYSCLGCHNNDPNDNIPDKTLEQAIAGAADMHVAK